MNKENKKTNGNAPRTLGAIALYPIENGQGDFRFMSLNTGNAITRHKWKELPVPTEVAHRVESIDENNGRKKIRGETLRFDWPRMRNIFRRPIHLEESAGQS